MTKSNLTILQSISFKTFRAVTWQLKDLIWIFSKRWNNQIDVTDVVYTNCRHDMNQMENLMKHGKYATWG